MALEVHPRVRGALASPAVPLFVTEGPRKVDALISAGALAVVGVLGVWNWRGRNDDNGLALLPDWELVALNDGRPVYVVFDSDILLKQPVAMAMNRMGAVLTRMGANVAYVRLPVGEGGAKVGADDFLAAGHTLNDITALSVEAPPELLHQRHVAKTEALPKVPAPETAELLDAIDAFIHRFVILPSSHGYVALALFILHSWAFHSAHATPYIVVESPEKQSGKTRLLEVLELVCHESVQAASITAAGLFQTVGRAHPTLLIDEADAIFAGSTERSEDLRGVLNAGNVPGATVIRGGKDGEPLSYDVFCPKVIAGIATGKLPDTIRDRAIVVPIDRKLKTERVERLRRYQLRDEVTQLCAQLKAWEQQHRDELLAYELAEPILQISDRLEEAWEPLFAVASLAGSEWQHMAYTASVLLARGDVGDSPPVGHMLLADIREVFGTAQAEVLSTRDLTSGLNQKDYWRSWNDGIGVNERNLAKYLKAYRVSPRTVRLADSATAKGYRREWFEEAFAHYLADESAPQPSQRHNPVNIGDSGDSEASQEGTCDGYESPEDPREHWDVTVCRQETGQKGNKRDDRPSDPSRRLTLRFPKQRTPAEKRARARQKKRWTDMGK